MDGDQEPQALLVIISARSRDPTVIPKNCKFCRKSLETLPHISKRHASCKQYAQARMLDGPSFERQNPASGPCLNAQTSNAAHQDGEQNRAMPKPSQTAASRADCG